MEEQNVRIVQLPAMRVASFHAFSQTPETDAWKKLATWAKANDCWQAAPVRRVFGFNNPDPSPGSPNYGYEFWLTINNEFEENSGIRIIDFPGGLYAVMNCNVSADPWDIIPSTWGRLVKWLESGHYKHGNHQWLEEHLSRGDQNDQGFILDLYLPIAE